ncbi:hypothetical protein IP86_15165 [Rhodopseudomonas sp. AAP120]|uniref:hypothetical protein n=1 Tax=Rhodopseudomonas sp. AAP120 TaxID=1523430 RepID=UPI0006B97AC2|nr:hypothetical protein [Rhodopseudomonas sp. AAP120]KPF96839.1 hypothetical protein IP86_15165 [Rhodopseudomonas sp. AAP120]
MPIATCCQTGAGDVPKAAVAAVAAVMVAAAIASTSAVAQAPSPNRLPPVTIETPPPSPLLPAAPVTAPPALDLNSAARGGVGQGPAQGGPERCGDAAPGNDRAFGCLNQRLKRTVDQVNPVMNTPPIDAKSSDLKVGTVNIPAVQQQYGSNFGISAMPYRPNMSFTSPRGR